MQRQVGLVARFGAHVRVVALPFFFAWPTAVFAQFESMRFEHLTINDGLSQSSIIALAQDRRGYLWIGTQDGLNRYDGYRFDVMRNDPDDPNSLSNNNISSIFEDSAGELWVGTTGSTLHRYVRDYGDFERYPLPGTDRAENSNGPSMDVRAIFESSDGSFWIGTDGHGLYSFDRTTARFENFPGAGSNSINVFAEPKRGELWVGSSEDLARYTIDNGTLLPLDPKNGMLVDHEIRTIEIMRNGEVWAAGSAGLISRFDDNGRLLDTISMPSNGATNDDAVRSLLEDSHGQKWVGLIGGGLRALSDTGDVIATLAHSPRDPYTLNSNTAYVLLEDNAGVLWVGSLEAGLSKSVLGSGGFTHLRQVPGDPAGLSDNMVIELAEDENGGIWVGSSGGGLNYLPPGASRFSHYRAVAADPASLSSDRIWGMHLEPGGPLWVGTWGGGLNRFDRVTATGG